MSETTGETAETAIVMLNQIVAAEGGHRKRSNDAITQLYHLMQKDPMFTGIARVYTPAQEDGETFPNEESKVMTTVPELTAKASKTWVDLFDLTLTKDVANMEAVADVVVDGKVLLTNIPVTTLLFLEKRLDDVKAFISKLPVLDMAVDWEPSPSMAGVYESPIVMTKRTKKVHRNHVISEATTQHPAQVQVYTEDMPAGTWSTKNFSGAIPGVERDALLENVLKFSEAVKHARERANTSPVTPCEMGNSVMEFIFGETERAIAH